MDKFKLDPIFNQFPIGPITDKIYYMEKNDNLMDMKWRSIVGDGNCFYRGFMFSILELFVLKGDTNEIKRIMCDLYNSLDYEFSNKNYVIDKEQIISIFLIIIKEIEFENIKGSYEFLLKAYSKFENFDYVIDINIGSNKIYASSSL